MERSRSSRERPAGSAGDARWPWRGRGAKVVVNYHSNHEAAQEVVAAIRRSGGEALAWQADVADRDRVEAMIEAAWERFGPVDTLVANAVTSARKSFLETDLETFRRTLDVALFGNFHVCQAVARRLARAKLEGSMTVIGSLDAGSTRCPSHLITTSPRQQCTT